MSSFVKDVFSGFRILSLWFICLFPQCFKNVAFPSCFIVSSEKFTAILIFLCNIFLWMLLIFYFITCFEKFDFGILWCDLLIFLLLDVHKTSWILLGFIVFIKFGGFSIIIFSYVLSVPYSLCYSSGTSVTSILHLKLNSVHVSPVLLFPQIFPFCLLFFIIFIAIASRSPAFLLQCIIFHQPSVFFFKSQTLLPSLEICSGFLPYLFNFLNRWNVVMVTVWCLYLLILTFMSVLDCLSFNFL